MIEENDKIIIEKELDEILAKFNNHEFINQHFNEYSKTLKYTQLRNQNRFKKKRKCAIIGCDKRSISKSHSIPKSSILKNIAFNSHLYKPIIDITTDFPSIQMLNMGINDASVFPGFCEAHERIFQSFEVDGVIDNAKKAMLQCLRTICRERIEIEIKIEINQLTRDEYKKKVNEEARESIKKALAKHYQFNEIRNEIRNLSINGIDNALSKLNFLDSILQEKLLLINDFEKYIYGWLTKSSLGSNLIVRVTELDIHLPIAMCGFGCCSYIKNQCEDNAILLVNILPKEDSTTIICAGLIKDEEILNKFFELSFSNPMCTLNMVESFMVYGSDHWYISPIYWDKIKKEKQDKILYDILYTENSFINEYPISIFDDIRTYIISTLKSNITDDGRELTKYEKEFINKENNKIHQPSFNIVKDKDILISKIMNRAKQYQ